MADTGWYPDPQNPQAQPYPPATGWAAPPPAPGGWAAPPPPAPRRRRRGPIVGAVLVVVAALVLGVMLLLTSGGDAPSLTYQGKEIASASDTLKTAEANVAGLVRRRHGASNAQTRCYFAQPQPPASGAKKTDVDAALRCGPVLFVDGDPAATYLSVPITGSGDAGGKSTLETSSSLDSLEPAAVRGDVKLVRPDRKKAPDGAGGLTVPTPPPATKDVLTTAPLLPGTNPKVVQYAVLNGKDISVTLQDAGYVARYGLGDRARSAPAGQRLLAFQIGYGPGDLSTSGVPRATIVIGARAAQIVPDTDSSSEWDVAAVPVGATVRLRLVDGGFTQYLSLPDGTAGPDNIAVLGRSTRSYGLSEEFDVGAHFSDSTGYGDATWHATATDASLDFWYPGETTRHASNVHKAILGVRLHYTDPDSPGKTFGFDPAFLHLRLPNGALLQARNIARPGKIFDVFEVPAEFTTGRLQISGSEVVNGVTARITTPRSFTITIPGG